MHCHGWLFHSFQSRPARPHHIPDVSIPPPHPGEQNISRSCRKPKEGPKIFMESDIKITGMQNTKRSTEGACRIFMPNHSQVQRAARNDHAELCTLYPLASTKAVCRPFFCPHPLPQEYQSELLQPDDKSSSSKSVEVSGSE